MKRILLSTLTLFLLFGLKVQASVSPEQATDPEYLINGGFSEALAEEVSLEKNRVNGKPIEPLYGKSSNRFVRFWRNLYGYIDPSIDTEERIHHDIHMSPSWRDL